MHVDLDVVGAAEDGGTQAAAADDEVDFESVHQALRRLEALDAAQGRLVELRCFGGSASRKAAEIMEISPATAKREWAVARAFLQRELTAWPQR